MSIIYSSECGHYISHYSLIKRCYEYVSSDSNNAQGSFILNQCLFKIIEPFSSKKAESNKKKRKRKFFENVSHCSLDVLNDEIAYVKEAYTKLKSELEDRGLLECLKTEGCTNSDALNTAECIYKQTVKCALPTLFGGNGKSAVIKSVLNERYLFPANCSFYCDDIKNIERNLSQNEYDLILLDPPWWNKYIRRKKAKTEHAYEMMYNDDLKEIPIHKLLSNKGLVVVWCTNSQKHLIDLINEIFDRWEVKFLAKWYWMKITVTGEPVCSFSPPGGKQPYEQIIFAAKNTDLFKNLQLEDKKIIASVPSALHSHKPPLMELLHPHVVENPRCLEIFARYLLPNWTSFGLEVLRFQHLSLYEEISRK